MNGCILVIAFKCFKFFEVSMIKYQLRTFKKLLLPFHNHKYWEISEIFYNQN